MFGLKDDQWHTFRKGTDYKAFLIRRKKSQICSIMKIKELNRSKTPIVKINKTLDKIASKVLFPDKLEEANRILKTVGLPKTK